MDDVGSFEDVKRLMEEERGLWDNAELAAGNKPGREARWNALVSKRLGPMFRKVKFKTPEVKERARLWYDAFTSTGRIDAGRRELLASRKKPKPEEPRQPEGPVVDTDTAAKELREWRKELGLGGEA